MPELSLIEIIKGLKELWELLLIERERPGQSKQIDKINCLLNITNEAISKLQLLEQVEENGTEKRTNLDARKRMGSGWSNSEYRLAASAFNEAIDLCNAEWVRRLDKEKLIEKIECFEISGTIIFSSEVTPQKLAQAIITHLSKKIIKDL